MKNYSFNKSIIPSKRKNKLAVTIVMLFAMVISFFNIPMIVHAATPKIKSLSAPSSSGEIGDELEFTVSFDLLDGSVKNASLNIIIPKGLTLLTNETKFYEDDLVYGTPTLDTESNTYTIKFQAGKGGVHSVTCKVKINEDAQAAKSKIIKCKLQYGETGADTSDPEELFFYTFGFDLFMKTPAQVALPGASFTLHRTGENNAKYYYTNPADENNNFEPRFTAIQEGTEPTKLTTDVNGKISFSGLKSGSYILTQTATAEGYEVLDPLTITIEDEGTLSVKDETTGKTYEDIGYQHSEGSVYGTLTLNNNHEILTYIPATGGVGVTAFYITGGLLMCGAVVLLIINKRKLFGLK